MNLVSLDLDLADEGPRCAHPAILKLLEPTPRRLLPRSRWTLDVDPGRARLVRVERTAEIR